MLKIAKQGGKSRRVAWGRRNWLYGRLKGICLTIKAMSTGEKGIVTLEEMDELAKIAAGIEELLNNKNFYDNIIREIF